MRVMLLVTDLQRGGTPLRIARLARGLRDAGVEAHVGCLSPPGPVSDDLVRDGVPTFACGAQGVTDVRALLRLIEHVRRIGPNLIHSTLFHANVAARLVGRLCRVPVVSSTATIEVERRLHAVVERLTARLDYGHVVNSRAVAEHVRTCFRVPRAKIHYVPPSVELPMAQAATLSESGAADRRSGMAGVRDAARQALGVAAHEFVVLWSGRLDPVKRLDLLVKTAEVMSGVPVRFFVAGDGAARDRLERSLRLSGAVRRVHLLGWRDDLPALLTAADAFFFPSLTEGMPNAVLEAMAAGLPVVAADIPALRELAGDDPDDAHSQRLVLVHSGRPVAFADALTRLARDESRRYEIGRRAAAWAAQNLSPSATVAATLRVYEAVTG